MRERRGGTTEEPGGEGWPLEGPLSGKQGSMRRRVTWDGRRSSGYYRDECAKATVRSVIPLTVSRRAAVGKAKGCSITWKPLVLDVMRPVGFAICTYFKSVAVKLRNAKNMSFPPSPFHSPEKTEAMRVFPPSPPT